MFKRGNKPTTFYSFLRSWNKKQILLLFCIFRAAWHFSSFGGGTEVGADLNNPATKNINVSCGLISNKLGERKISKSLNKLCSGRILSKYICWLYVRIRNLSCPIFVQRASHILYWESEELATLRCDAKKTTEKVHFRAMMCVNLTSGSHYHKQRSTPCHCLSTQEHYTMPLQISI